MPPRARATSRLFALDAAAWRAAGAPALAPRLYDGAAPAFAVALRAHLAAPEAEALARRVEAARAHWTEDFHGEQFALGRAFYTHLETQRTSEYFADAARSDARVEAALPGFQGSLRALFAALTGGLARPRPGFCGAGVHVFLPGCPVARRGGVVHFDTEGLTPLQLRRGARALSLVLMLRPGAAGAGLRLWPARYEGPRGDEGTDEQRAQPSLRVRYGAGDALLFDSYRLHQITRFRGDRARVSATLHGVEVDRGVWETWF